MVLLKYFRKYILPAFRNASNLFHKIIRSLNDASPGSRAWPGRHRDKAVGARLDWGEKLPRSDGRIVRTLVMQPNKDAVHEELRKMAGRDSHQKILTLEIDVSAPPDEEAFISKWSNQLANLPTGAGDSAKCGEHHAEENDDGNTGSKKGRGKKKSGRK